MATCRLPVSQKPVGPFFHLEPGGGIARGSTEDPMRPFQPKEPDLRRVRLLLIRALDLVPPAGPEWHPASQAAKRVREHLRGARREVEAFLGPDE